VIKSQIPLSVLLLCAAVLVPAGGAAQSLSAKPLAEAPPSAVADAVRPLLAEEGVRVTAGAAALDFWWVKTLPVRDGAGAATWERVEEGTLVGAVRIGALYRDIRGRTIKPGVYTLRFGIQPANGDHLGVSPFRQFLLISPVGTDKDPKPLGHDPAVELAKATIGSSHPAVWSLNPPVARNAVLSASVNDEGHEAIVFEVPTSGGTTLRFGLILIGKIEA
jgi:hypothetical protein